jgi:triosephosphate isomerase
MAPRALVAGNWKMNGLQRSAAELTRMIDGTRGLAAPVDVLVCPPATLLAGFAALAQDSHIRIGAQDCHPEPAGPFTGDISAEMLKDAGATAVIVGHSERRVLHHEADADVRAKALAAWRAGLVAIVCIGESEAQREAGETLGIIGTQLQGSVPDGVTTENTVIAYEPVWAIGTGRTPTLGDVGEVHGFIRGWLSVRCGGTGEGIRILYGGSVKASNAAELMAVDNVNGALVGGASLKAEEFLAIIGGYL